MKMKGRGMFCIIVIEFMRSQPMNGRKDIQAYSMLMG
jgi:hypothetical protein